MRFFIALEIPDDCREQIAIVQSQLQQIIPQIRLTNNEKLHLTLAFAGEQPDKLKDDLIKVIESSTLNITPFKITPAYIDGFPELHHAHVFWMGVKGDIDKLMIIRERIKDGLIALGLDPDERRYVPHIAMAKLDGSFTLTPTQEEQLQEIITSNFNPINISSIKLFESIPEEPARNATQSVAGGGFHKHNTLAEIPLQESLVQNQTTDFTRETI